MSVATSPEEIAQNNGINAIYIGTFLFVHISKPNVKIQIGQQAVPNIG